MRRQTTDSAMGVIRRIPHPPKGMTRRVDGEARIGNTVPMIPLVFRILLVVAPLALGVNAEPSSEETLESRRLYREMLLERDRWTRESKDSVTRVLRRFPASPGRETALFDLLVRVSDRRMPDLIRGLVDEDWKTRPGSPPDRPTACRIAARAALQHRDPDLANAVWWSFQNLCDGWRYRFQGHSEEILWRRSWPDRDRGEEVDVVRRRNRDRDSFDVQVTRYRYEGIRRGFRSVARDTVAARCDTFNDCRLARPLPASGLLKLRPLVAEDHSEDMVLRSRREASRLRLPDRDLIWVHPSSSVDGSDSSVVEVLARGGRTTTHVPDVAGIVSLMRSPDASREAIGVAVRNGEDVAFLELSETTRDDSPLRAKLWSWPAVVGTGDSIEVEGIVVDPRDPSGRISCASVTLQVEVDGINQLLWDSIPCSEGRIRGRIAVPSVAHDSVTMIPRLATVPTKRQREIQIDPSLPKEMVRVVPWMRAPETGVRFEPPKRGATGTWSDWEIRVVDRFGKPLEDRDVRIRWSRRGWISPRDSGTERGMEFPADRWVVRKLDSRGRLAVPRFDSEMDSMFHHLTVLVEGAGGRVDTSRAIHRPPLVERRRLRFRTAVVGSKSDPRIVIQWWDTSPKQPTWYRVRRTDGTGPALDTLLSTLPGGAGVLEVRSGLTGVHRFRFVRQGRDSLVDSVLVEVERAGILSQIVEDTSKATQDSLVLRWDGPAYPFPTLALLFERDSLVSVLPYDPRDPAARLSLLRKPDPSTGPTTMLIGSWRGRGSGSMPRVLRMDPIKPDQVRILDATTRRVSGSDSLDLVVRIEGPNPKGSNGRRFRVFLQDARHDPRQGTLRIMVPTSSMLEDGAPIHLASRLSRGEPLPRSVPIVDSLPSRREAFPKSWVRRCTRCRAEPPVAEEKQNVPNPYVNGGRALYDPEDICILYGRRPFPPPPTPVGVHLRSVHEKAATQEFVVDVDSSETLNVRFAAPPVVTNWMVRLVHWDGVSEVYDVSFPLRSPSEER